MSGCYKYDYNRILERYISNNNRCYDYIIIIRQYDDYESSQCICAGNSSHSTRHTRLTDTTVTTKDRHDSRTGRQTVTHSDVATAQLVLTNLLLDLDCILIQLNNDMSVYIIST